MSSVTTSDESTIAAVSTAQGEGGVAVIRVSGEKARAILRKIFVPAGKSGFSERRLSFGRIIDPETEETVDEVLCVMMSSPNTYTGEDVAEIHSHGGHLVPARILEILTDLGARPAAPGEFTQRAFLNGKMDLAQAEAVSDIIGAQTERSLRYARAQLEGSLSVAVNALKDRILDVLAEIEANLDFPEEDIDPVLKERLREEGASVERELSALVASYDRGRMFRDGVTAVILGKPNVGKSSILNRLVGRRRAIVSPIPGTTRDFIEERVNVGGIPLIVADTAGIRNAEDEVEKIGVELSLAKAEEAEFVLAVLDRSSELDALDMEVVEKAKTKKHLVVLNKSDLEGKIETEKLYRVADPESVVGTSARDGTGMDRLEEAIFETLSGPESGLDASELVLTNLRHKNSMKKALDHLRAFLDLLGKDEYPEILSVDLRSSMNSLGEITGEVTTEDLLGRIFSRFCIGK